jgi:2OG-Fe(II) oxygenase superfamily
MNKENIKSIFNYVDPQDAQSIIDFIEKAILEEKVRVGDDKTLRIYNGDFNDQVLLDFVDKYAKKFIDGRDLYVSAYLIARYSDGSFMSAHRDVPDDREVVSTVLYLNDSYTGGELVFPEIDGGYTYKPSKYEFIYFPTEYLHGVNPVTAGRRYIVTISYTDKPELAYK